MLGQRLLAAAASMRKEPPAQNQSVTRQTLDQIYVKAALSKLYNDSAGLSESKKEIRLLHLQPGEGTAPLRCSMTTASLMDDPKFEALSYTWHDSEKLNETPNKPVRVNNVLIYTLSNLSKALHSLRLKDVERTLWIDYLCIDQSNKDEVSHQVQMMGELYSSATQVVVCLSFAEQEALEVMELMADNALDPENYFGTVFEKWSSQECERKVNLVTTVFKHSWWSRIWTVQETVLAKTLVIYCDNRAIAGQIAMQACKYCYNHLRCCHQYLLRNNFFFDIAGPMIYALFREPGCRHIYCDKTFYTLLHYFPSCQASDPRDLIFGLYGLLDSEHRLIKPDYTWSVAHTYTAVTYRIMKEDRSLALLAMVDVKGRMIGLPSWVLDLTHRGDNRSLHLRYTSMKKSWEKVQHIERVTETELQLRGVFVDTVCEVYTSPNDGILGPDDFFATDLLQYIRWVKGISRPFYEESREEGDQDDPQDAILRTMVGGRSSSTDRVGSDIVNVGNLKRTFAETQVLKRTEDMGYESLIDIVGIEHTGWFRDVSIFKSLGRFFSTVGDTGRGRIGMGPRSSRPGDRVIKFQGGAAPFIIRPSEEEHGKYQYVGIAYIDGTMDQFQSVRELDKRRVTESMEDYLSYFGRVLNEWREAEAELEWENIVLC